MFYGVALSVPSLEKRWSFGRSNGITDGVNFVFLGVPLDTPKLHSLVKILDIVRAVPAKFSVLLSLLDVPDYRSLVFAEMFSLQFTVTDECYLLLKLPDTTNLTAVRTEINIINFLFMCGKIVDAVEVWKGEDPEMSVISTGS